MRLKLDTDRRELIIIMLLVIVMLIDKNDLAFLLSRFIN